MLPNLNRIKTMQCNFFDWRKKVDTCSAYFYTNRPIEKEVKLIKCLFNIQCCSPPIMTEVNLCPSTQFWSIWTVPLKNCSSPLYELPCKIWSLSLKKRLSYPLTPMKLSLFWHPWNFFSHHLFGLSIQTLVQNLESVAQQMSELLH